MASLFEVDVDDVSDLWNSNMGDLELVNEVEKLERYSPIVEDISMDDETLYKAVEKIEFE